MKIKSKFLKIILVVIIFFILNVITVILGDDQSRLTVMNKTDFYLHISIDGNIYPYVAPNHSVTYSTNAKPTIFCEIFYSPGQGKLFTILDSTFTLPYTPPSTTTYGDDYSCQCSDPNSDYSCSESNRDVVNVPAQGGNATWEISDSDFEN